MVEQIQAVLRKEKINCSCNVYCNGDVRSW